MTLKQNKTKILLKQKSVNFSGLEWGWLKLWERLWFQKNQETPDFSTSGRCWFHQDEQSRVRGEEKAGPGVPRKLCVEQGI